MDGLENLTPLERELYTSLKQMTSLFQSILPLTTKGVMNDGMEFVREARVVLRKVEEAMR